MTSIFLALSAQAMDVLPNAGETQCLRVEKVQQSNLSLTMFYNCSVDRDGKSCDSNCEQLGKQAGYTQFEIDSLKLKHPFKYSLWSNVKTKAANASDIGAGVGTAVGGTVGAFAAPETLGASIVVIGIAGRVLGWAAGGIEGSIAGTYRYYSSVHPLDESVVSDELIHLRDSSVKTFIEELKSDLNSI